VPTGVQGFPATYTEGEPVTFQLLGDLTVRDVTVPVGFDVTATLDGGTITGTATATANMSDFGFDPPDMMNMFTVQDEFQIQLEFTLQEQA
jgi:polyisoprenoid-binding protein YceI